MKLGIRIFLLVSGLVAASLLALSLTVYVLQHSQLHDLISESLATSRDSAMVGFENYLQSVDQDINFWSSAPTTRDALAQFSQDWASLGDDPQGELQSLYIDGNPNPNGEKDKLDGADDDSRYTSTHQRFHPTFRSLKNERGYYDIFLIDVDGNVVYSVYKELDFATNMLDGAYADTGLGQAFRSLRDAADGSLAFMDFAPYAPSNGAPASFIARRVNGPSGEFLGVIAFQMPVDRLGALVGDLGHGVHALVIGADNLLRNNDSRFGAEAILRQQISSDVISQALSGMAANGDQVREDSTFLQSAAPFEFHGSKWAFVAEIDQELAFAPLVILRSIILVASAICLIVAAISARILGVSLSRPITNLSDTLRQLIDGNRTAEIGYQDRPDEIGEIASSVHYFKDKLVEMDALQKENEATAAREREAEREKRRLEDEAREAEKQQAEAERQALEKQRETEAAIAIEISEVVQSCANGDFTRSINLGGKDGVTSELCSGINKIGEVVDGGLSEISAAMTALSRGDLTYRLKGEHAGIFGKIASDINATMDSLKDIISTIRDSSNTSTQIVGELTAGADSLAERTEKNAAALEQTSAAMTELEASVRATSENSAQAQEETRSVVRTTDNGLETVKATVEAMEKIKESSQSIAKFTELIDNISFQTNLLALNAGVEAARAGDAGRGFAVVANEVRDLAGRSAEAAREISDFVSESNSRIETGVQLTSKSMEALESIGAAVRDVTERIEGVSQSSKEQSTSIAEITSATAMLDNATQENAAMFEETTAAIQLLESEVNGLKAAIGAFDTGDTASLPGNPASAQPSAKRTMSANASAPGARHGNLAITANVDPSEDDWQEF